MRLYLSSYEFGSHPEAMFGLLRGEKKKVAIITNATDMYPEAGTVERLNQDIEFFKQNQLTAERLDLREYFGKEVELAKKMDEYSLVWAKGGNSFLLRFAMKISGFDTWLLEALKRDSIVYAGFSAGGCVLNPSLEGVEINDDPKVVEEVYGEPADHSGLAILKYHFEPHFSSDHPESAGTDEEIAYLEKRGIPYKALRDGEAIVIDGDKEVVLNL